MIPVSAENLDCPSVLVVGTGAVGGFYGAKLWQAGASVRVWARRDYEVVSQQGLKIQSVWGDFHFSPSQVVSHLQAMANPPDYLLIALKVLPEIDVPALIRPVVGPQTAIVLLQNGVEIEDPVAQAFPTNDLISGLVFACITRTGPGQIDHQDYGRLAIGHYPQGKSQATERLGTLFQKAGVPCDVVENVVRARWRKLVWNAPFNPISVLAGEVDTRMMLDSSEVALLARSVMEEVAALAKAVGAALPEEVVQKNMEDTQVMHPYRPSMLLDFEAGRPMEVEAILGNAVRAARRVGLAVPRLQTLYALLKLLDERQRQQSFP